MKYRGRASTRQQYYLNSKNKIITQKAQPVYGYGSPSIGWLCYRAATLIGPVATVVIGLILFSRACVVPSPIYYIIKEVLKEATTFAERV